MWTLLFWTTSQSKQSQNSSSLWVMRLIFVQSVCFETNISIGLFVTKINPPLRIGNFCLVWSSTSSTWSLIGVALRYYWRIMPEFYFCYVPGSTDRYLFCVWVHEENFYLQCLELRRQLLSDLTILILWPWIICLREACVKKIKLDLKPTPEAYFSRRK